jgi:hypothetical protein
VARLRRRRVPCVDHARRGSRNPAGRGGVLKLVSCSVRSTGDNTHVNGGWSRLGFGGCELLVKQVPVETRSTQIPSAGSILLRLSRSARAFVDFRHKPHSCLDPGRANDEPSRLRSWTRCMSNICPPFLADARPGTTRIWRDSSTCRARRRRDAHRQAVKSAAIGPWCGAVRIRAFPALAQHAPVTNCRGSLTMPRQTVGLRT